MRLKKGVDFMEICGRAEDKGDCYIVVDDLFDEFVSVDKASGEIRNCGFNGMLTDFVRMGFIEL